MAVTSAQVSVGTTATALNTAGTSGQRLVVSNAGTNDVLLGPSGVTTVTGLALAATDGPIVIELAPGEVLFGIVATGTETVQVLRSGS